MKKNMSCKGIRTNIASPTHSFRQNSKRNLNLEMLTCKNQSPKIEFPATTKSPPDNALRKKIFSNSKHFLASNENISQANLSPSSPLGQSGKAYDQLKYNISSLEGRLVEIKKNFEVSFQKRNEKSKLGKQNTDSLREKQKSRLALTKHDQKPEKIKLQRPERSEKQLKIDKDYPRCKEVKDQPLRRTNIQLKPEKTDNANLQDYVTSFSCQSPTMLSHCSSDANLFKPHKHSKDTKQSQRYYIDVVINAFSSTKPTSFEQLCRTHLITSMQILQFIKNANKVMPNQPVSLRPLPPTNKPTIIFDLDQTLIHCNQNSNMPCDVLLPIKFPNGTVVKAGINIRPYARECLQELSKDYELIVFTASHECYANVIIDYIDPKRLISHRYFRDSCWKSEQGFYVKDLRVIDRDLRNVLLVDNAAYSYCFHLDNGVPIVPFYDNKADLELKSLIGHVKSLGSKLRERNAAVMRLREYWTVNETKELLNKLYGSQN